MTNKYLEKIASDEASQKKIGLGRATTNIIGGALGGHIVGHIAGGILSGGLRGRGPAALRTLKGGTTAGARYGASSGAISAFEQAREHNKSVEKSKK